MAEQIARVADARVHVDEAEELSLEGRVCHRLSEDAALHGPSGHERGSRFGRAPLDHRLVEPHSDLVDAKLRVRWRLSHGGGELADLGADLAAGRPRYGLYVCRRLSAGLAALFGRAVGRAAARRFAEGLALGPGLQLVLELEVLLRLVAGFDLDRIGLGRRTGGLRQLRRRFAGRRVGQSGRLVPLRSLRRHGSLAFVLAVGLHERREPAGGDHEQEGMQYLVLTGSGLAGPGDLGGD